MSKTLFRNLTKKDNGIVIDYQYLFTAATEISQENNILLKNVTEKYKDINQNLQTLYEIVNISIKRHIQLTKEEIYNLSELIGLLIVNHFEINSADCLISLGLLTVSSLFFLNSDFDLVNVIKDDPDFVQKDNLLIERVIYSLKSRNFKICYTNAYLAICQDITESQQDVICNILIKIVNEEKSDFVNIYLKSVILKKLTDFLGKSEFAMKFKDKIASISLSYVRKCQIIKQSVIRNNTRTLLIDLLKFYKNNENIVNKKDVESLLIDVLNQPWSYFSKYNYLACFVTEYDCNLLIENEPNLVDVLLNAAKEYSLWSYICDLFLALACHVEKYHDNIIRIFISPPDDEKISEFICRFFIPKLTTLNCGVLLKLIIRVLDASKLITKPIATSIFYILFKSKRKILDETSKNHLLTSLFNDSSDFNNDPDLVEMYFAIICKELQLKSSNDLLWDKLMVIIQENMLDLSNKLAKHFTASLTMLFVDGQTNKTQKFHGFRQRFNELIVNNIYPGVSFQKRNLMLSYLKLVVESAKFDDYRDFDDLNAVERAGFLKTLLYLMTDSFDENRKSAQISFVYYYNKWNSPEIDTQQLLSISQDKAFSANPSYCSIAQILFETIVQLNHSPVDCLSICKFLIIKITEICANVKNNFDLIEMSMNHPYYSALSCLRCLLIENFDQLQSKIDFSELLLLCQSIFTQIYPIIASLAPEGCLPEDIEQDVRGKLTNNYAEYLQVCCWRTCKELSLLLSEVACKILRIKNKTLDVTFIESIICGFFFNNITKVTHKGAFESMSVAMKLLLSEIWLSDIDPIKSLVDQLIDDSLNILVGRAQNIYTRRSAGLPSLFHALITSQPKINNQRTSLDFVCQQIFRLMEQLDSENPQDQFTLIHIFNILRLVFKDASLSHQITSWTFVSLKYSIKHYSNKVWSIRNAATLLFCAIVERIFGPSKSSLVHGDYNRLNSKVFFNRYAGCYEYFVEQSGFLLKQPLNLGNSLDIYPLLVILSRLIPEPEDCYNIIYSLDSFRHVCIYYLNSPVWTVRVSAAKAFASLSVNKHQSIEVMLNELDNVLSHKSISNNNVHGVIKSLIFLFETDSSTISINERETIELLQRLWRLVTNKKIIDIIWCEFVEFLERFNGSYLLDKNIDVPEIHHLQSISQVKLLSIFHKSINDDKHLTALITTALENNHYKVKEELIKQMLRNTVLLQRYLNGNSKWVLKLFEMWSNCTNQPTLESKLIELIQFSIEQYGHNNDNNNQYYTQIFELAWSKLTGTQHHSIITQTKCVLIELFGCLHHYSNRQSIKSYLKCLRVYANYEQDFTLRLAVAKSLQRYLEINQLDCCNYQSIFHLILIGQYDENSSVRQISNINQQIMIECGGDSVSIDLIDENNQLLGYSTRYLSSTNNNQSIEGGVFDAEEINFYYDFMTILRNTRNHTPITYSFWLRLIESCDLLDIMSSPNTFLARFQRHLIDQ